MLPGYVRLVDGAFYPYCVKKAWFTSRHYVARGLAFLDVCVDGTRDCSMLYQTNGRIGRFVVVAMVFTGRRLMKT